ncbi:hypothetical protein [Streptomyces violaceusniger]|uniref:hypothetical protein n=1 Tax=Streptomyces violaceusniger TaxID=68280 RepID=UPI000B20CF37|nr:hypothetical protein [Streptomyces violaceusniger]
MEDALSAAQILERLLDSVVVAADSKKALIGSVETAARAEDKKRQRNQQKQAEEAEREGRPRKEAPPELRRKQGLRALPGSELGASVRLPYIALLHDLARGLSLTQRGAARGLAEHWGSLKYIQALRAGKGSFLWLSGEGKRIAKHYKTLQSEELGQAFALTLAERILRSRYPHHHVSILHSDTVLRAGWALTSAERENKDNKSVSVGYRYRPQYLAEVWKPDQPSMIFPIACKGNHSGASVSHTQLAACAAYVDGVHIGSWDETPGLVFSTELPLDGPVTVHVLHAPGHGSDLSLRGDEGSREVDLDQSPRQLEQFPGIERPAEAGRQVPFEPGCQVKPDQFAWFQQTFAHTDAAGLMAFAGAGRATARLLTKRQGREFFEAFEHPAAGSVQDITCTLLGDEFAGTDHVFRLNGDHVEAFSGVQTDLFRHLARGTRAGDDKTERAQVSAWRSTLRERRKAWPRTDWDDEWGGPVSIREDGTVLALRRVNVKKTGN